MSSPSRRPPRSRRRPQADATPTRAKPKPAHGRRCRARSRRRRPEPPRAPPTEGQGEGRRDAPRSREPRLRLDHRPPLPAVRRGQGGAADRRRHRLESPTKVDDGFVAVQVAPTAASSCTSRPTAGRSTRSPPATTTARSTPRRGLVATIPAASCACSIRRTSARPPAPHRRGPPRVVAERALAARPRPGRHRQLLTVAATGDDATGGPPRRRLQRDEHPVRRLGQQLAHRRARLRHTERPGPSPPARPRGDRSRSLSRTTPS